MPQRNKFPPKMKEMFLRLATFFFTAFFFLIILSTRHLLGIDPTYVQTDLGPNFGMGLMVMFLKLMPVILLIFFVYWTEIKPEYHNFPVFLGCQYKNIITVGMCFGLIADGFMVYRQFFIIGMFFLGIQYLVYTFAFGFCPFRPLLLVIYIIATPFLVYYLRDFPEKTIEVFIPYHLTVAMIMCWRAVARADFSFCGLASALAGVCFVVSDMVQLSEFFGRIPCGELVIMTHYYLAQLCVAITANDPTTVVPPTPKRRRRRRRQLTQETPL